MPALIRYRFEPGERFAIEASTDERVLVGGRTLLDVQAGFALDCVVAARDGDVVDLRGRFRAPKASGWAAGGLPPLESLEGLEIHVRKGLDGVVHEVRGAEPVESMFGGLTARNALRWFAAAFPEDARDRWEETDVWTLDAARTPLGVHLPMLPEIRVLYRYRAEDVRDGLAELSLDVAFSGEGRSGPLGLEIDVRGSGTGQVTVDLEAGKLRSSVKEAWVVLEPRPIRRGALALPPLRVERRSEAGFV